MEFTFLEWYNREEMISIVVPVYNEEDSLQSFYAELSLIFDSSRNYEIIFIDDGSFDNSLNLLKKIASKDKKVKIYSFRRNQGKSEALTFGFQKAKGDYIVTLDADLQDKPSEISKLLDKAKDGQDLVCGWRKVRKDPLQKRLSSRLFNFLTRKFWGLNLHDYNCGLKVYTKKAANSIRLYGGLHRFIPILVYQCGFSVTEVVVEHRERKFGKSKYGFSKLWKDLPDIFTMIFLSKYGDRPLHFFGVAGFLLLLPGVIILGYLATIKFMGQGIGERPILFLGMLLVLSGFQVLFTGFLADLFINLSKRSNSESFPNLSIKYSTDDLS